ncbi:MAG: hypothetical protein WA592_12395, partial [Pseudolabrys sp.]
AWPPQVLQNALSLPHPLSSPLPCVCYLALSAVQKMFPRQIYHLPTPQKSLQTPRHLLRERQITVIKPLNLFNVRNQLMQIKNAVRGL